MNTTRTITGSEPITLAEAKLFLKVDFTTDDTLITSLITAARAQAEEFSNRAFVAQTIEYYDTIPAGELGYSNVINLPYPNHTAITEIKINGTVSTDYTQTGLNSLGLLFKGLSVGDDGQNSTISVEYTAGDCPAAVKHALYNIIKEMYFNRSDGPISENGYAWLLPFKYYQ